MKVMTVLKWALVSYLVFLGYMLMYLFMIFTLIAIPTLIIALL
jgi:hypothetical protein